jgi:hypothetical protein
MVEKRAIPHQARVRDNRPKKYQKVNLRSKMANQNPLST